MENSIKVQKNSNMEHPIRQKIEPKNHHPIQCKPNPTIKILIVEDNLIVRSSMAEMIQNLGYKADFAENGKAALLQYCSDYHLILMDLDMPYLNGLEVTYIIRSIEKNHQLKNVPIVAISSHFDEPEYIEKCLAVGMNGLSGKPNAEQLKALIFKYSQNYISH